MKMILSVILLPVLITFASAQQISGVFTSFNSLEWQNGGGYPFAGPYFPSWKAKLGWKIDGSSMHGGDTFTLTMPCVFKFTTNEESVELSSGLTNYATCVFAPGSILSSTSELRCTILDTIQDSTLTTGTLTLPVTFNVGGSALGSDVYCANFFEGGSNTVSFSDGNNILSTEATFEPDTQTDPNETMYGARTIPNKNEAQIYVLSGECAQGLSSGTIGMTITNGSSIMDCSSVHAAMTNSLNDWYFPESADLLSTSTSYCNDSSFMVTYSNIPNGHRVFIDGLMSIVNGESPTVQYTNQYICDQSDSLIDGTTEVKWQPSYVNIDDFDVIVSSDNDATTATGANTDATTAATTTASSDSAASSASNPGTGANTGTNTGANTDATTTASSDSAASSASNPGTGANTDATTAASSDSASSPSSDAGTGANTDATTAASSDSSASSASNPGSRANTDASNSAAASPSSDAGSGANTDATAISSSKSLDNESGTATGINTDTTNSGSPAAPSEINAGTQGNQESNITANSESVENRPTNLSTLDTISSGVIASADNSETTDYSGDDDNENIPNSDIAGNYSENQESDNGYGYTASDDYYSSSSQSVAPAITSDSVDGVNSVRASPALSLLLTVLMAIF